MSYHGPHAAISGHPVAGPLQLLAVEPRFQFGFRREPAGLLPARRQAPLLDGNGRRSLVIGRKFQSQCPMPGVSGSCALSRRRLGGAHDHRAITGPSRHWPCPLGPREPAGSRRGSRPRTPQTRPSFFFLVNHGCLTVLGTGQIPVGQTIVVCGLPSCPAAARQTTKNDRLPHRTVKHP